MIGAIPNPTKKITVDFPFEQVKTGVKKIPALLKNYKMSKDNETFNFYTLEAYEFLSFGIYADFSLNQISDSKTEINLEIRRKIGSFNQSHEITLANKHIDQLITGLSKTITASPEDLVVESTKRSKSKLNTWAVIIGIWMGLWILGKILS
jgi:hypothetical protein